MELIIIGWLIGVIFGIGIGGNIANYLNKKTK